MDLDARSKRFLQVVAGHFVQNSTWPEAVELQRNLVAENAVDDLVVWDEVGRLSKELIRREPTGDGREILVLTVPGLAHSGVAKRELELFLKLVDHFADAWKRSLEEVPQSEFAKVLDVAPREADRIATILRTEGLIAYPAHTGEDGTIWRPAKNSVFQFRKIQNMDDYLATVGRIMGQPAQVAPDAPALEELSSSSLSELEGSLGENAKNGFVLMPFDVDLAWLHLVIRKAGALEGTRINRADDISSPGVVLEQIFEAIDAADVVVSVCTGRNPNVFFEMGYAWREHKVILVAANSAELSFDVRHYRTVLYREMDRATLEEQIRRAIRTVIAEERLPRGRRLKSPPSVKAVARLGARLEKGGKNHRLVLTNPGTLPVHQVDIELPPEAKSFHVITSDLPIKTLRPGQSVAIPALTTMGGGAGIFEIAVKGVTDDGEPVKEVVTLSIYG